MATQKPNKHKKQANRKLAYFIVTLLLIGAMIGGTIVGVACTVSANAEKTTSKPYGTRDGNTIQGEPPYEYLINDDFSPLDCSLSEELQEYTYYLCKAYYIDFNFAMALMYTESSFKEGIISATGDYGLMQINERNHSELSSALGINNFNEPHQNIRAGLYILRRLFEKYDDAARVCMAYNMGEYGASVLWEQGIYETSYSNKVLAKAEEYAAQLGAAANE
jgi:hypothetical protein